MATTLCTPVVPFRVPLPRKRKPTKRTAPAATGATRYSQHSQPSVSYRRSCSAFSAGVGSLNGCPDASAANLRSFQAFHSWRSSCRPLFSHLSAIMPNALPDAKTIIVQVTAGLTQLMLNQYQGGMCISGVLKTTERDPRNLPLPSGTPGLPPAARSGDMYISPWL